MGHVRQLSVGKAARFAVMSEADTLRGWSVGSSPVLADAKGDLLNSLYAAWVDFSYAKKNQAAG